MIIISNYAYSLLHVCCLEKDVLFNCCGLFVINIVFNILEVRYQCYGTWYAMRCSGRNCVGYTFAAISDTVEKDNRERFKCLVSL